MTSPSDRGDVARRAAQLEAILDNAVDAIITIDAGGIVQSTNPATERLFGYSPEEVLGNNVSLLMPSPFREEHDTYIKNYLRTGEAKIIGIGREVMGRRKDGSTFPIELAVSEAVVDGHHFFTGIIRDVSQRHEAEQSQASLGRIIEDSLNEIYIFDRDTLHFTQVNRGARENLGYSMNELREMTPLDLKEHVDAQSFDDLIQPLVAGEQRLVQFQTEHTRKDGSTYPVEVHLQLAKYAGRSVFVAIILDVTERMRAVELLRVQQRAIEAAGSGILITDPNAPDNPIVLANPAFYEITGYPPEEVLGLNCRFLQGDDRDQAAVGEMREAITNERECRVLLRNYRKDGTMFWNDLQISPVHDASGRVTHFIGISADVTKTKQDKDALRETILEKSEKLRVAESELIKQARLATLGQLFGGIAHEIRNPLNALRTSAYYLLHARSPSREKVEEHLQRIDRQVTIVDNIVTALSDVARMPKPNLSPVPLETWVPEAVREVSLPDHVEVRWEVPEELPPALVDVAQVPIALKNLIRNARDAMPDGGTIAIAAQQDGDVVRLTVSDTGKGIDPEVLPRIMEPLFTTKPKGMGLGLAISRAIIEKNKGTIHVETEAGAGTTFTVEFKTHLPDN